MLIPLQKSHQREKSSHGDDGSGGGDSHKYAKILTPTRPRRPMCTPPPTRYGPLVFLCIFKCFLLLYIYIRIYIFILAFLFAILPPATLGLVGVAQAAHWLVENNTILKAKSVREIDRSREGKRARYSACLFLAIYF